MPLNSKDDDTIEGYLTLWKERSFLNYKRKEITPRELSTMFQQKDLHNAFFNIVDHDKNGALSEEEWTGSFTKLLGDNDPALINWFVDKFRNYCNLNDKIYIDKNDFGLIVMDLEFGYRFAALIAPKCRKISTIQLITALEIIASLSTDAKWLSWLKYQFTEAIQHSSDRRNSQDCRVTFEDFKKNFNFKEPFLAQRLFNHLDTDKSGYLTLHEFINGLEVVVNGNDQEKMEFLFKVFDVDNDGYLDYTELRMLLKCCLDDSPSLDMEEAVDDLTTALFRNTDSDGSGDITLQELKEAFRKHDSLFKTLSVSTSVWIKPKFVAQKKKHNFYRRMKEEFLNKRHILIFWSIYILINIATFVTAFFNYYQIETIPVIIARIFGNSLNFNCALVLGLVLRKHFTWLRTKGANSFLPLDDYIDLHKVVGIVILIETIIHTVAHLVNLYFKCIEKNINYWTGLFTPIVFLGLPTGVFELLLLMLILAFTFPCVRKRGHFQLFYLFHLLSIPFLLIMLIHGKQFWKWLLVPGLLYTIEKILRFRKIRSHKFGVTYISEATILPSKVTHLVIKRPKKFHYKAGDYIFINIPAIAKYEWHPFSISSVPDLEDSLWLHVRAVGNWTSKLNSFVRSRLENKYTDETVLRTSMRSRMSRLLSDVSAQHIKKVSWNIHNKNNNINMNMNLNNNKNLNMSTTNCNVMFNADRRISRIESMKNLNNDDINPKVVVRKGILKGFSRDSTTQKSIDTNMSTNTNNLDLPTESTPKANNNNNNNNNNNYNNDSNDLTRTSPTENNNDSTAININLKEVAMMNSEELETFMQNLLDKKKSNIDTDALNLDKSKLYDKKSINDAIAIDMEGFKQEKQEIKLFNAATNTTVLSKNNKNNSDDEHVEDEHDDNDLKKIIINSEENNDILGYLKMYKKTNRICITQMPTNEQWSLKVYIDGPYETASRDIFDSEHVVLIAAGIGITPYASILQSIMQRFRKKKNLCPKCDYGWESNESNFKESSIKKVDFIWVTRDQRSLEWFISMLSQMEIDQKKNDQNFLETHLYVTSAQRQTDLKSIGLHMTLDVIYSEEDARFIEGLKRRTHYGRPNWDTVFQQLIRKQEGKISVFFCGPSSLSDVLQDKCRAYNLTYKKELF